MAKKQRNRNAYGAGLRSLTKGDLGGAIQSFKMAVDAIPPSERTRLCKALNFLGIALLRSGQKNVAIRSWASARRLVHDSPAARFHSRYVNEYGMVRRSTALGDDFAAFCSLHVCRYLGTKKNGSFDSGDEREMVEHVVRQSFAELYSRKELRSAPVEAKIRAFKASKLDFPVALKFDFTDPVSTEPSRVDFLRGRCMDAEDRCACGSGLEFSRCCGRISTPAERFGSC